MPATAKPAALTRPALDPGTLEPRTHSTYPDPFRARVLPREKRAVGAALGLTTLGVNVTTLAPGAESSMRHRHSHEEEFVYVLEGEAVLHTDGGEQLLTAGMCAGFPAGATDAHHLVNRGDRPVRYLEVGLRHPDDAATYPDDDLAYGPGPDGTKRFTHKDGTAYLQAPATPKGS